MLTAEGCRARRQRFLDRLKPTHPVVLADPIHLRYFANYHVEDISMSADFGGLLVIRPDASATVYHDNKLPKVSPGFADEEIITWYTGQEAETSHRRTALLAAVKANGGHIHDSLADGLAPKVHNIIAEMRRHKDPDEVALLKTCMKACDAGHAWGRANIKPGMTELEVYAGVANA